MNPGILLKSLREMAPPTILLGVGLFVVEGALAAILPRVGEQARGAVLQMPFAQTMVKAMLGTDTLPEVGPQLFQSIPWAHPVVLALVWAHAIIGATRLPAGEIDRGTIDILIGLPVSRWRLLITDTAAWVLCGAAILAMAAAGNAAGSLLAPPGERPSAATLAVVIANLAALYLAVAGCACLISSVCDRSGKAMAAAFVAVLASFLLNYLAQLWEPAERFAFLSILRYYRPLYILRDGVWPWADLAVLLGIGGACWAAGAAAFARRDLSTI